MPAEPIITITQLIDQQDQLRRKEQDIKAKRAKIKVFQGLPPVRTPAMLKKDPVIMRPLVSEPRLGPNGAAQSPTRADEADPLEGGVASQDGGCSRLIAKQRTYFI
jgi:hypothetical protein